MCKGCWTNRSAAPLTAVPSQALSGPASATASGALRVGRQIAFAPVMYMPRLTARTVRRVLLAICRCEVHAFSVDVVFADWNIIA